MNNKSMTVPFADMVRNTNAIREQLHQAAIRVIDSGHYIGGPEVTGFEQEMAQWLGVDEICATGCATSGLTACLKGLGVGAGDEVITTVHTAIPTAEAITLSGAGVVFADIDGAGAYNMNVDLLEPLITDKTKAIIAVHLYGQPLDLDVICALAEKHGLYVIEDCAQAQGARYKGQLVGTRGDAAAFSFFPSKNLGGFGDGGAITAKQPEVLKKARMFCNHGRIKKYLHEFEGMNSRLDALQAALLRVELTQLDAWNAARYTAAQRYRQALASVSDVICPKELPETDPVYHVFVIMVDDREALAAYLKEKGISTGVHYPASLNMQPAYAYMNQGKGHFPKAEYACNHMLSLPMFPSITEEEIDYTCEQIKTYFSR